MPQRTCSVDSCDRKHYCKGYCTKHYNRLRATGTVDGPEPHGLSECAMDGCTNKPRTPLTPVCEMHYYRRRRNGTYGPGERLQRERRGTCSITGCEKPDCGLHGLCFMHKARLDRNGDPNVVITGEAFKQRVPRGERHRDWTGDEATYEAVHSRVKAARGRASTHPCVDCGGPAWQWSYNHDDPNEKSSERGFYSLRIESYSPRCTRCHKRFDLNVIRRRRDQAS